MNRLYNYFLTGCLYILLITVFSTGAVYAQQEIQTQKGVLRIKVTPAYASKLEQSVSGRRAVNVLSTGSMKLNQANTRYKATSMKRVFPNGGKYEAKHRKHGLHLWYEVQIDSTAPVSGARAAYQDIPEIEIAEPVHKKAIVDYDRKKFKILSPAIVSPLKDGGSLSPAMNDPMLDKQWHYNNHGQTNGKVGADINLLKAWSIETGKRDVIVAVVDGGIEVTHPDLKDNIWINVNEIPGNGIDDDNNGFADDVNGFSFVDWRPTITPHFHGTHVAGTVAAVNNNGIGVSGVAGGTGNGDGVRLMNCNVFRHLTPQVEVSGGFENAYVYAADNGAVISQNSWGYNEFGAYDQVVLDAIDYFVAEAGQDENGIQTGPMKGGIVIFSAGNDGSNGMKYPAYYDKTFSVASLNHRDIKAYYSNYGDWVDIAAPGGEMGLNPEAEGILSTFIGGQYAYLAGTSMAAPHVSGTAALLISHFGGANFTPDMLRQRLVSTADYVGDDNPDYPGMLGAGRINAFNALNGENDLTGPSAITDLQVKVVTDTALTLQWTAPYDNGSHSASYYEVRYATSPITSANFKNAIYVPNQPRTNPAGTIETFTIAGLKNETSYYVAVLSYDMFRNASLLSNITQATTHKPVKKPAPVITINPFPLEIEMLPTDSVVKTVYITNTGNADLTYTIERNEGYGTLEETYHILTFSKRSGTVAPGKKDTLLLTFKPVNIAFWIYETFNVASNDPDRDTLAWPIQVTFKETKGKPVFTATQVDIGKTMVGTNSEKTVGLKSTGSKEIRLLKYSIDNPDFSAYIGDFFPMGNYNFCTLANYDTMMFKVFFHPSTKGKKTGVLTINTNDPENPILTLPLSGEGLSAPAVLVSVDTLSASLKTNESITHNVTISNTGESDMTFNILENSLITEPKKVLVLCPDAGAVAMPSLLSPFSEISVDIPDHLSDLNLADLVNYDVVIVLNLNTWRAGGDIEPEKLGDLLADYIDAGGKVIVNQFAYYGFQDYYEGTIGLAGRFITENYGPFFGDVTSYIPPLTMGEILTPNHPLLEGVHKLTYNGTLQRVKLSPGGTGIAKWSSGDWMLAANSNVIAMNFMPFGQRDSDHPVTGDLRPLYRNAIYWLTGSTHLTVQPATGTIAPGNSVVLDVQINSNKLATGLYHSALGISTNDPYHGQVIIPTGIEVQGPSFSLTPDTVSLTAAINQQATQYATLSNEGTEAFQYAINLQHTQSISHIVADSTSNQYYSTGFSGFNIARLTGRQDWADSGRWYIDTVAAFSGRQHLRYTSNGMSNPAKLISPAIERGSGKSFCSVEIMIEGQGTTFAVSPLATPSYSPVTTVSFGGDGSVRVVVYDEQMASFDIKQIKEPIPTGYFTLSFDIDKATSVFNVYFNQRLVFTGTSPFQSINAFEFDCDNRSAGQNLYIDNVILHQGGNVPMPEFLQVSPLSGTLLPGEETTLTLNADAKGLQAGEYATDLIASIGNGTDQRSVPVSFTVTGGASVMKVSHEVINAVINYGTTEARFFEISNFGGEPFQFTVEVPEEAKPWLTVEPASGTAAPNSISVIKVNYTSASVTPGNYSSSISVKSNATNVQRKVIETSLEVHEPAMLFMSHAPFIQLEIIGGNSMNELLPFVNGGNSVLQLKFEETKKNWLTVNTDMKYINPQGGQLAVPVTLSAIDVSAGVYKDTLRIHTNDPKNSILQIPVQLTVIAPAALDASTDTLHVALARGTQVSKTINVDNAGAAELHYVISNRTIDNITMYHGGPDAFGYTFINSHQPGGPAFVWNDITSTGVPAALSDYDSLTVTLPFAFPFYGQKQHEVTISPDGFLTFGAVGLPTRTQDDRYLFNSAAPNNLIAGFWIDLDPRLSGTIHYKKEADKFTVQYTNVSVNTWGIPTGPNLQNTFQIVLHADGSIAFHYLNVLNSGQQTAGIENSNATDAFSVYDTQDYSSQDSLSLFIVPTVSWINVASQSNAVRGGGQNQVEVQFDAANLDEGIYPAVLYLTSNDRNNPVKRIPVKMNVDLTTGTVKEETKETVSVYPVPAKDVLNIKLTRGNAREVNLIIRNAQGQMIFEQEVDQSKMPEYTLYLNPLHLSPGIYFLQVVSHDGRIATKPFVKQ